MKKTGSNIEYLQTHFFISFFTIVSLPPCLSTNIDSTGKCCDAYRCAGYLYASFLQIWKPGEKFPVQSWMVDPSSVTSRSSLCSVFGPAAVSAVVPVTEASRGGRSRTTASTAAASASERQNRGFMVFSFLMINNK